jgi:hypothetical protein
MKSTLPFDWPDVKGAGEMGFAWGDFTAGSQNVNIEPLPITEVTSMCP